MQVDDSEHFLTALARGIEPEERLILCGFRGDPNTVAPTAWRPRPWAPGREVPFVAKDNAYVTVSAFGRAPDRSYRRRGDLFGAGLALMVDDVGTKVPRETVEKMPPSARIETSPGNEQWWYFLDRPMRDRENFDAIIRAFISGKLLGADPGMSGVTRVGRLPGFVNGKEKYGGFTTILHALDPERRFSEADLLAGFAIEKKGKQRLRAVLTDKTQEAERRRAFLLVYDALSAARAFKRPEPDPSGWIEMRCPWVDEHTAGADTGAAIREPAEENGYYGAFRCHHGHCADRGWADLTDRIAGANWDELEAANERAKQ